MTREEMIDALVDEDISDIFRSNYYGDYSFLDSVLRGDGWKPYNQLTDEEIQSEYDELINR